MNKFVCIHGHFYQPPRENPWLNEVELQESAYPYHDWNERVNAECYARNAFSRILDDQRRIMEIVNNYSKISFNFGPTLLSWLEEKSPEIYEAILEADRVSQKNFSGHGSAIAQVYSHMIMPLANQRDKRTQVLWGIKDFEYRFKRKPEGMWLAETAVDVATLEMLAEYGIKFTILAPSQAGKIRHMKGDGAWIDLYGQKVNSKIAYLCRLPSGQSIHIFFYDGALAQAVAFGGLLNNGEAFAHRLMSEFDYHKSENQLVNLATDGETYGHHHKFGDMALSYCLYSIEHQDQINLTVYGEFLEKCPAEYEVMVVENSSWSCAHGVERWRSNCGCETGGGQGWNQNWRKPLRESLDWLRDQLMEVYQKQIATFAADGWTLRDQYIDVILKRSPENLEAFLNQHIPKALTEEERIRLLKLLEMQYNALLMYTSCGWFFSEISGIETIQILKYAARAIQLAQEITGVDLEEGFISRLEQAPSNIGEYKNGANIYRILVKPSVVDLLRVGAHFAVISLFEKYPKKVQMYCYTIECDFYELKEAGRLRLAVGHGWVSSNITGEKAQVRFSVLHLGDHNFIGGMDYQKGEDFHQIYAPLMEAFKESNVPQMISFINHHFDARSYSLWDLFKQEQENVLNHVLHSTIEDMEYSFRQIYENHYPLMQIKNDTRLPLPRMLTTVVEFILARDMVLLIEQDDLQIEKMKVLVAEMKRWAFKRDQANFSFLASKRMGVFMQRLLDHPDNIELLEKITVAFELFDQLKLDLDLWKVQNLYFLMATKMYPAISAVSAQDELAKQWVVLFERLGDVLQVEYDPSSSKGVLVNE